MKAKLLGLKDVAFISKSSHFVDGRMLTGIYPLWQPNRFDTKSFCQGTVVHFAEPVSTIGQHGGDDRFHELPIKIPARKTSALPNVIFKFGDSSSALTLRR
jgi:hypothetical protein